ncbi:MAG: hypothetical protein QGI60_04710 [archaeon]|jgi:hypothetical protein|nr:hypothetical protein [archaeon]
MPTKTYLVLALALMLALSGCIQQPIEEEDDLITGADDEEYTPKPIFDGTADPSPAPIPGNCDAMETQFEKDQCTFGAAIEADDPAPCAGISEQWLRNNCISGIARVNLDTSVCSEMESAYGSDNTNVKNSCISEVAIEVFYKDECFNLRGSLWEVRCADNMEKRFTQECIELESQAWDSLCWDKAMQICNEISSQSWRDVCIKKSAIESGEEEKCMGLHGFERDTCIEEIAAAYKNAEICESILDAQIKQICIERVGTGPNPTLE